MEIENIVGFEYKIHYSRSSAFKDLFWNAGYCIKTSAAYSEYCRRNMIPATYIQIVIIIKIEIPCPEVW